VSAAAFGFATARTTTARIGRFAEDSLSTASPSQLLVKLYERLLLDIARAEANQRRGDHIAASGQLVHAQAIVAELSGSLDVDAWSGGPGLMSVYTFLGNELIQANLTHDPARTASCRQIVEPLADAWRQAAAGGTAPVPAARSAAVTSAADLGATGTVPAARTSLIG